MTHTHDYNEPSIDSILNIDLNLLGNEADSLKKYNEINDIWHRLWTALTFEYQFPEIKEKSSKTSYQLRRKLETSLGVVIADEECDQLRIHVMNHAKKNILSND